jgi:nitroreductase
VLLIPCHPGRFDDRPALATIATCGSVLPAFWSFMLAARARGLGTAWTTLHLMYEQEAADVLGIPFDSVTQFGLTPVAYTKGTDFQPAHRAPLDTVLHVDSW